MLQGSAFPPGLPGFSTEHVRNLSGNTRAFKNMKSKPGESAQLVKGLLCSCEDQSELGSPGSHLQRQADPRALWPASLANTELQFLRVP